MIAIHGTIASNDIALIDELKKYFEADEVILNWNGKDSKDNHNKTTLLITNQKLPYKVNCHIITLKAAQQLLAA